MLRKVSAVGICLLFTLGILSFSGLLTQPVNAGYNEYKQVTWVTHYYDAEGDFCRYTTFITKVPILNSHYEQCHTAPPPGGGRIPGDCTHPHGYTITVYETIATSVTLHDEDC